MRPVIPGPKPPSEIKTPFGIGLLEFGGKPKPKPKPKLKPPTT